MFRVRYLPSTSHWIVPPAIIKILIFIFVVLVIQRFLKQKKKNEPFITLKNYSFFEKNWDKLKLIGSLVFFVLYIFAMDIIGFLAASIIFVFIFNILYSGVDKIPVALKGDRIAAKSFINSILISVIFSVFVWFLFGKVFNITLP